MVKDSKDAVGLQYDSKKDKDMWDYATSLKYNTEIDDKLRRQALALGRIKDIVREAIKECDATFDGIELKDGELLKSTSSIGKIDITAENILGGHSGRVYFDLPQEYNEKILDIISNGDTSNTVYVSKLQSIIEAFKSFEFTNIWKNPYKEAVYPRFAATHGIAETEDGKIIEKKLTPTESAITGTKDYVIGNSTHYGVDFVQQDGEKKNINDGTVGHLYINTDSTKTRSAIGFGLEGSAPMTGGHSMSGGADRHSAFGGPKYYVKVENEVVYTEGLGRYVGRFARYVSEGKDQIKGNSKDYISDLCEGFGIKDKSNVENKIIQAKKDIDSDRKKDEGKEVIFKKIDIGDERDVYVVNTLGDNNSYIVTEYAMKELYKSNTIPKYNNGMNIRVEDVKHKGFIDYIDKELREIKDGTNIDSNTVKFLKIYDKNQNMFEAIDGNFKADELQQISDKLIDHTIKEKLSGFAQILKDIDGKDLNPSEIFLKKFTEDQREEFLENIENLSKDQGFFQTLIYYLNGLYNSVFGKEYEGKNTADELTLHNAARSDSCGVVEYLIDKCGKDVNEKDIGGNTALYYALKDNKEITAEFLVYKGANILGENVNEGLQDKYILIAQKIQSDQNYENIRRLINGEELYDSPRGVDDKNNAKKLSHSDDGKSPRTDNDKSDGDRSQNGSERTKKWSDGVMNEKNNAKESVIKK
ncbi:MAG: hypothetical protein ACI8ZF_000351 [Candidatus Midichloriaceae bacterium]|jgi:hypothetical protein